MAELVDAHDSKSCSFGSVGSIPTFGTNKEMEKTVIVGLVNRNQNQKKSQEYLDELEFLSITAGGVVEKRFTQRIGQNSKMIVTGDISQIDLRKNQSSGLIDAQKKLNNIEGVGFTFLDSSDVLRHSLVKKILDKYQKS